jgi:hypothetical protein
MKKAPPVKRRGFLFFRIGNVQLRNLFSIAGTMRR